MQQDSSYNLYCCDCIKGAEKYLSDNSVDLIITDPPYGIQGDQLHRHYHRNENMVIDGYVEVPRDEYPEFSMAWIAQAERVLRPGGAIYIVSGHTNLLDILTALNNTQLEERNHIIWKYNFGVFTSKKYITSHYHILYYTKPGGKVTFNTHSRYGSQEKNPHNGSLNYQDREDVWIINREYKPRQVKNKNELPEQLLIKLLQYSSNAGDLVADFFLGGFSSARLALLMNRRIVGFEINQKSFDYHLEAIKKIIPGQLLNKLKTGKQDLPENQKKPWSQTDLVQLKLRYDKLIYEKKTKAQVIACLQEEFGRGYFAIINKISEISER
jgi:site-specific DNA-methyltransferase (adenine-specific)